MKFYSFLNKKSHSLLELLVILGVVAVLVSVGLPAYKGVQNEGKISQAQAELKTMQAALTSYYLNSHHMYPVSSASLGSSTLAGTSPRILRNVLYDPFVTGNSTEYGYQVSSNGQYYVIYSKGASGNGTVSINNSGVVTPSNGAVCTTNGSGCNTIAAHAAAAGTATDSCGGCTGGKRCDNGTCVDVSSNVNYCGTSLAVCSGGQICTNGTCCASGQIGCNGTCSTLTSDSNNCGGCGTVCPGTLSCISSVCACAGGFTNCSNQCMNLQTDNSNCGSCGSVCSGSCLSGVCCTVPGAPTGVTATAGNTSASVTFTAPASNGNSAITSYTVTSSPGGLTSSGSSTTQTVTGLTNGTSYTFTVTATNAIGTGPASAASNAVTPVAGTVPGAPIIGTATAGNGQATITFTAPASNGGSAITSYAVISNTGNVISGAGSPIVFTGLTNGTSYTFTVTATNSIGTGAASGASNAVTPCTVPDAPTGVIATAGSAQATVTFTAPASNGGSAITSYTVVSSPGGFTSSGLSTTQTVTGLANGMAYTFTVVAYNAAGKGPFSAASNSVTPCLALASSCVSDGQCCANICTNAAVCAATCTAPNTPTGLTATAGQGQATVTFPSPLDGGCAISGCNLYEYVNGVAKGSSMFRTNALCTGGVLTQVSLTPGTSYTFTLTETNSAGTSAESAASNAVIPCDPVLGDTCSSNATCCTAYCVSSSCFVPGTKILLADGRIKEIQDLKDPDVLLGANGAHNKVVHLMIMPKEDRKIYAFNGGKYFVTESHCFMTQEGWKALNPMIARLDNPKLRIGQLEIGDELVTLKGKMRLKKIDFKIVKNSVVYNPQLDGYHDYYADGFLVHNAVGKSGTCAASCGAPAPPSTGSKPTASATNGQALIRFTAPTFNGGCAVTSYTVTSNPGSYTATGVGTPLTVTGLTNGTSYTFTVTATSTGGTSNPSSASSAVTPYTVPGAPTIGTATAGIAQATVTFTAPGSNGGSAITSYTVTSSPGGFTATGPASPLTVTGLTAGTSYTFTVTATNAAGTGPASAASNVITPLNGTAYTVTTTGSGSWQVPSGVTIVYIELWGGGGGGGMAYCMGGGAGAYVKATNLAVTPGSTITYIIASGGQGGFNNSSTIPLGGSGYQSGGNGSVSPSGLNSGGGGGGSSSVVVGSTTYIASGGGGAASGVGGAASGSSGGAGGDGHGAYSGGGGGGGAGTVGADATTTSGGAGGTGATTQTGANGSGSTLCGGGSSAGVSGSGNTSASSTGATGSGGAAGGINGGNGANGSGSDSGGGGGGSSGGSGGNGGQPGAGGGGIVYTTQAGNGGPGELVITYTP